MAVYTGKFHEQDIIRGTRVQKTQDTLTPNVVSASRVARSSLAGKKDEMLLGQLKPLTYNTYSTLIVDGLLVPTAAVDPNRHYRVIPGDPYGTLISSLVASRIVNPEIRRGDRDRKILSGVGAQSVMFEQTQTTTPEQKSIRRWPRDWHGENMN